jgi:hypothetical protein
MFKEQGLEMLKIVLGLSFCFSTAIFVLPVLSLFDKDRRSEKGEVVFSLVAFAIGLTINILSLLTVDYITHYMILIKLVLGVLLSLCVYIPILMACVICESYSEIKLSQAEKRDANLDNILSKFGW